jgi:hypothetical protein
MKRPLDVLTTRLRKRKNKPKREYDRNELVDDDMQLCDVLALVKAAEDGQARYDYDDGRDYIPFKIFGARTTNNCLEYHLQYIGHQGRSWTHESHFNDDQGEDRGWNPLVQDWWARCALDPSLTDVLPPDPPPRARQRRPNTITPRLFYHTKALRHFSDWKSFDEILTAGDLTHYKPAAYPVKLIDIRRGIEDKRPQVVNDLLTTFAKQVFPNQDAVVLQLSLT